MAGPGGARSVVARFVLIKGQLLPSIGLGNDHQNLRLSDRLVLRAR
jgi:hypothetical protein